MPIVVNKYKEVYDVYIGRGSIWGNPFVIGVDGDREEVINLYKRYLYDNLRSGKIRMDSLLKLRGKKLGCYCKPKPCHGDVIVTAYKYYSQIV